MNFDKITISSSDILQFSDGVPQLQVEKSKFETLRIADLAVACSACKSLSEARRLCKGGGLYLNNIQITDADKHVDFNVHMTTEDVSFLRIGSKRQYIINIIDK